MVEVALAGFIGDVPADVRALVALVEGVTRETGASVQLLRGERVWDRAHLARAVELASRAFAEGRNRADGLGLEVLCYAAGERQIERALARLGLAAGTRGAHVAVVAVGEGGPAALALLAARTGWRRADAVVLDGARGEDVLDALGVDSDSRRGFPREAWGGLVLERVALVDLPKG